MSLEDKLQPSATFEDGNNERRRKYDWDITWAETTKLKKPPQKTHQVPSKWIRQQKQRLSASQSTRMNAESLIRFKPATVTKNHKCLGCWRLQTSSSCLESITTPNASSSLDCVCGGGAWKQWPETSPTLSPASRQIVFSMTSSFLGRHCDGTQLAAYGRHHRDDGCASWQDLSWIFWEHLPQMNESGRRFIWHISRRRRESVQSLPILAQQAPYWCPCRPFTSAVST